MTTHPAVLTAEQLAQMMADIQHFIEHPRIQQKRWVEKGRAWLPLLQHARAHLLTYSGQPAPEPTGQPAPQAALPGAGLEVRPRDTATWGYSWNGAALTGAYPTFMQALEAALREHLPRR